MTIEIQEKAKLLVNGPESSSQNSAAGRTQSAAQRLDALLEGTGATLNSAQAGILVRQVACDSRKVQPQALFFALQGAKTDGSTFARDAVSRGAVAVVSEVAAPQSLPQSVAWIQVPNARRALAIAAANFYGHPANARWWKDWDRHNNRPSRCRNRPK